MKRINQSPIVKCLFCGNEIIAEETERKWLFDCDSCGSVWESEGKTIPKIKVITRTEIREELDFED
jgi:uncharacterized Zn finger protein